MTERIAYSSTLMEILKAWHGITYQQAINTDIQYTLCLKKTRKL